MAEVRVVGVPPATPAIAALQVVLLLVVARYDGCPIVGIGLHLLPSARVFHTCHKVCRNGIARAIAKRRRARRDGSRERVTDVTLSATSMGSQLQDGSVKHTK